MLSVLVHYQYLSVSRLKHSFKLHTVISNVLPRQLMTTSIKRHLNAVLSQLAELRV